MGPLHFLSRLGFFFLFFFQFFSFFFRISNVPKRKMNLILSMTFMAIAASVIAIHGESADGIEGKKSRAAATYTAEEYANYDAKAFARDLPQLKTTNVHRCRSCQSP